MKAVIRVVLSSTLCFALGSAQATISVVADRPANATAVKVLRNNKQLLAHLSIILKTDKFTKARQTVSLFVHPETRALLHNLQPAGTSKVALAQAGHVSSVLSNTALALAGTAAAGLGVYLCFTNKIQQCSHHYTCNCPEVPVNMLLGDLGAGNAVLAYGALAAVLGFATIGGTNLYKTHKQYQWLHALMQQIVAYQKQLAKLASLVEQSPELLAALPDLALLQKPFEATQEAKDLAALLKSPTLQEDAAVFSVRGRTHAAYALMHQICTQADEAFSASLQAVNDLQKALDAAQGA